VAVAELEIDAVSRSFGDVSAVVDATLSMGRGEIVSFLGPSGCGKSTLLNLVAGFERPDSGEIRIRGQRVNEIPPNRRPTALVFQSYALFPHMTVAQNVTYGPRMRGLPSAEIDARARECFGLLKLEGLETRYPAQLSGGQRQRVAVARALAVRPDLLLLDEALSALDKGLREEMQIELSLLLRRLEMTAILVTHDQREAFALADRVAVMEEGRIVQVGTAIEVYDAPRTPFVLGFLGHVNRLSVSLEPAGGGDVVAHGHGLSARVPGANAWSTGREADLCVRSVDIGLALAPTAVHQSAPGTVRLQSFLGSTRRFVVDLAGQEVVIESARGSAAGNVEFASGDRAYLDFDSARSFVARR
jgi:ABC-type Fe3+/spermidine/putrescine transport system ATPase subunit